MEKIRYKYRPSKYGVQLGKISCPVCGNKHLNWTKPIQSFEWNGDLALLAECYEGPDEPLKPRHLFVIYIDKSAVPLVEISKTKRKGNGGG